METSKIVKYSLLTIILALLGYAGYFTFKQYKLYLQSKFEFLRATLDKITMKSVTLTLYFSFKNETDVNFTVKNQYYEIYIDGKYYKSLQNSDIIHVPSKQQAAIPITVSIQYKEVGEMLSQNIVKIARNYKGLELSVRGHLTVNVEGKLLQLKDFPIDYTDTIGNIV